MQVPENIQKKQQREAKAQEQAVKDKQARHVQNVKRKSEYLSRAQKHAKAHHEAQRALVQQKREARAQGAFFVPAEAKVALVIRIRGINKLHPDVKKIMRLFRLRQLHNAVLVKLNKATMNMLRRVEPYVTYGYPSKETISHLLYKRGHGKVNKQRIPLTDNRIVEAALAAKTDIICMEDLVQELFSCGPHFKQANNFVWPFKLRCPKGGFVAKRHSYLAGGDFGPREDKINELVKKML